MPDTLMPPIPAGISGLAFVPQGSLVVSLTDAAYEGGMDFTGLVSSIATFNDAIDDVHDAGGGVVFLPRGFVFIDSTLAWQNGVALMGGWAGNSTAMPPIISWNSRDNSKAGAEGGIMIATDVSASNRAMPLRGLAILGNKTGAPLHRPGTLVQFNNRCDAGTDIEACWFQNAETGLDFTLGGINVNIDGGRFDAFAEQAIKWATNGTDVLHLLNFESDTRRTDLGYAGRLVKTTISAANDSMRLDMSDLNLELNVGYQDTSHAALEFVLFSTNQSLTTLRQVVLSLRSVRHAVAGGIDADHSIGILWNPGDADAQVVRMDSASGGWTQRNKATNATPARLLSSLMGSSPVRPFVVHSPNGPDSPGSASLVQLAEIFGDINLAGQLWTAGKRSAPVILSSVTDVFYDTAPYTVQAGQMFLDPASLGVAIQTLKQCTAAGTLGTLTGVTGTGNVGTAVLTLVGANFKYLCTGQYITVGGNSYRIKGITDYAGQVVSLTTNLLTSPAAAAVTFTAPTFYALTLVHSVPVSSTQDLANAGLGYLAMNYSFDGISASTAPAAGSQYGFPIGLFAGQTVTNLDLAVAVAGGGAAPTLIKVVLANSAGVVVAHSNDLSANAIWTTVRVAPAPLSAQYVVPADGTYIVCFLLVGAFGGAALALGRKAVLVATALGTPLAGKISPMSIYGTGLTDVTADGATLPGFSTGGSGTNLTYWVGAS